MKTKLELVSNEIAKNFDRYIHMKHTNVRAEVEQKLKNDYVINGWSGGQNDRMLFSTMLSMCRAIEENKQ